MTDNNTIKEHPLRQKLNDELHARPPIPLENPHLVTYFAFTHEGATAEDEHAHLRKLASLLGLPETPIGGVHRILNAGSLRIKWERHNEFSTYTIFRKVEPGTARGETALEALPAGWRQDIPGQLIVATHVEVRTVSEIPPDEVMSRFSPSGPQTVISRVGEDDGWLFTDFRIDEGFSRFLLLDASLTPRQAGRMVQRVVEIETYRMMALLGFPVAKEVGRLVTRAESELAALIDRTGQAANPEDEHQVLADLTRLAAEVEHSVASTTFRFGASRAYYRLVMQRIDDLRETRLPGFPTVREFMERRLAPAMDTCAAIARRQEELTARIARSSQLLRTRVDVELERQNQALLAQMNRRAKLQLHLQETVEGLSVVAITYYASQLVQYVSKGIKEWLPASPEAITALSIPVIAGVVALGLHRMRQSLAQADAH